MNQDEIQKELRESRKKLEDLIKNNPDDLDESFEHEKGYLEGKIMGLEIAINSNGDLPYNKCPNCKEENPEWEWSGWEIYDSQQVNTATCQNCKAQFDEIMEVIYWEKQEINIDEAIKYLEDHNSSPLTNNEKEIIALAKKLKEDES